MLFVLFLTVSLCLADDPSCSGYSADGRLFFDLTSLQGRNVSVQDSQFKYDISICANTQSCGDCKDSGFCQFYSSSSEWCVGRFTGVTGDLQNGTDVAIIHYDGGEENRSGTVEVVCDLFVSVPSDFEVLSSQNLSYKIRFRSPAACAQYSGLSGGSVLLIIFFSIFAVYFFGGVLWNYVINHKQSYETIPNLEFWVQLPGFVKDGIVFSLRCCRPY
eukprot:TRINITY_DN2026_c0_g1_i15.p1 TRINITY_DN2026_c0_g1~~TRINITY_DN2026_c0_g1_i15.p1  ORF type:complete len:217 (+),score=19.89 TRINITY_DN2026_c0_g1_i15:126-776(+)